MAMPSPSKNEPKWVQIANGWYESGMARAMYIPHQRKWAVLLLAADGASHDMICTVLTLRAAKDRVRRMRLDAAERKEKR